MSLESRVLRRLLRLLALFTAIGMLDDDGGMSCHKNRVIG